MAKISEAELILPSLYIMSLRRDGKITTSELISELRVMLKPDAENQEILKKRKDDKFSQIVRNLVSHKTLTTLSYAIYENGTFTITDAGIFYINEKGNKSFIEENFIEDFEGAESLEIINPNENVDDDDTTSKKIVGVSRPTKALNIERINFSIYELKRRMQKGKLVLDPDFQRENVWSLFQKSELVESILMNIPLPYIYLTEDSIGRLIVVDGRQRLTSLFGFIDGDFRLSRKLRILQDIGGKKFQDLDTIDQGIIEDYQLNTHVIKPPLTDRILIDIFDRVNRSGTTLNNQEIRNALYQGKSTKLLKELAESELFKAATDHSIKSERMRDKYLILRFLSFYIWKTNYGEGLENHIVDYKGDSEEFLPKYMQHINAMDEEQIDRLKAIFNTAMSNAVEILGKDAFRLSNKKDNKKRPINMALFDSLGYLLSHEVVRENPDKFAVEYQNLLSNEDFIKSFLSIDSTVKYRFEVMDSILKRME